MRAHAATLNCERILGLPLRGLPLLLELGVCHYGHQDGRATGLRLPFGGVFHNGVVCCRFSPFAGPEPGHDVASMLTGLVRALSHLRPQWMPRVGRLDLTFVILSLALMFVADRLLGSFKKYKNWNFCA